MKKTMLIIASAALVTGVAIKATPAVSQTLPAETNVSVVRIADLDLSTQADQRQLDRRLSIAASEVCGNASDADLRGKNEARQCRKDVLASARTKVQAIIVAAKPQTTLVASRD